MEEKPTVGKISMKYGLILGLLGIVYFLILNFAGVAGKSNLYSYLNYVIIIVMIFMAHKAFKDEGDSFMSYSQGLGIGTLVALISGVLSSAFMFFYLKFVDDSMIQNLKDAQMTQFEERGMSPEQIDQAMNMSSKFMTPGIMVLFGIFGSALIGFIIALVVSAITKKTNPQLAD